MTRSMTDHPSGPTQSSMKNGAHTKEGDACYSGLESLHNELVKAEKPVSEQQATLADFRRFDFPDDFKAERDRRVNEVTNEIRNHLDTLRLHTPLMLDIAKAALQPLARRAIARVIVEQDHQAHIARKAGNHRFLTTGYIDNEYYSENAKDRAQVTLDVTKVLCLFSDELLQGMIEGNVPLIVKNRGPKVIVGSTKTERRPWVYVHMLTTKDGLNMKLGQLDQLIDLLELYCLGCSKDGLDTSDPEKKKQLCRRQVPPSPAEEQLIKTIDNFGIRPGTSNKFVSWQRPRFFWEHSSVDHYPRYIQNLKDLRARARWHLLMDPNARLLIPGVTQVGRTFDHRGTKTAQSGYSESSVPLMALTDAICRSIIEPDLGMHYYNVAMAPQPDLFPLTEHVVAMLIRSYAWEDEVAGLNVLPAGHSAEMGNADQHNDIYAMARLDVKADNVLGQTCRGMVAEMQQDAFDVKNAKECLGTIERTTAVKKETEALKEKHEELSKELVHKQLALRQDLRNAIQETEDLKAETLRLQEEARIREHGYKCLERLVDRWTRYNKKEKWTPPEDDTNDTFAQTMADPRMAALYAEGD